MSHDLVFSAVEDTQVVFTCSVYGEKIGFVLPEFGTPNPILTDTGWIPPENPEQWLGPCNVL